MDEVATALGRACDGRSGMVGKGWSPTAEKFSSRAAASSDAAFEEESGSLELSEDFDPLVPLSRRPLGVVSMSTCREGPAVDG